VVLEHVVYAAVVFGSLLHDEVGCSAMGATSSTTGLSGMVGEGGEQPGANRQRTRALQAQNMRCVVGWLHLS
jgi:hypothetical protein